jgi:hypothetical protein
MSPAPTTPEAAREDLAFMRSLVAPSDDFLRSFGAIYALAGLCYGVQMLLHGAQLAGWVQGETAGYVIGFGPTAVVLLVIVAWRIRRRSAGAPTLANRATGGVFSAVGMANLASAAIVGLSAWRMQNFNVWLIFPCIVMVMQGAAWLVAWEVRKRTWFLAVAWGWFATGVAMGVAIGNLAAYVAIIGIGMFAFMLAPGAYMMRRPKAD